MSQSLVRNVVHIVFSTKYRKPLIRPEIENDLYRYIAATCLNLECYDPCVGGYRNHVHILCAMTKNAPLSTIVKKIKVASSLMMKSKHQVREFYWQLGYAAFSVSCNRRDGVARYIKNQAWHHDRQQFEHELIKLLKAQKIVYDERYLWD
jgi:putative transposase